MIRRESSVRFILNNTVAFCLEAVADENKINYILRLLMMEIRVKCRIIFRFFGNELAVLENSALNHIDVAVCALRNIEVTRDNNGAIKLGGKLIDEPYTVLSCLLASVIEVCVHRNKGLAALVFGKLCP